MNRLALPLCLILATLTTLPAASALAASGVIVGDWSLYNGNGNYCPSGTDCTGSYYVQSEYNTTAPIKNARVFVHSEGVGVIGQGSTDDRGHMSVGWYYPGTLPNGGRVSVYVTTLHKDGRFNVNNSAGQYPNYWSPAITAVDGGTANNGSWVAAALAPDPFLNVYWAAEKTWRESFALSGELQAKFTGVEIRGFANNIPGFNGNCPTSCAAGKHVQLDANAALMPEERVMHEMGHVANLLPIAYHGLSDYNWPGHSGSSGWSATSSEWGVVILEEATASFAGFTTLWAPNSVHPASCLSAGPCFTGSTVWESADLELTHYAHTVNSCSTSATNPESRWPLSAMRTLWDIYDDRNDADGDTVKDGWDCYSCFWDVRASYASGFGTNQVDEPWTDSTYGTIDNYDGRGMTSYVNNYNAAYGRNVNILRVDNCSPP